MNGWTPQRKLRQTQQINKWKPWGRSTGPKTAEGKARSRMNAWKHGGRDAKIRALHAALAEHGRTLREMQRRTSLD